MRVELESSLGKDKMSEHWTTQIIRRHIAPQGHKFAYLPHGGHPYEDGYHSPKRFMGANTLGEVEQHADLGRVKKLFPLGTKVFFGISPQHGNGLQQHLCMAHIYPGDGDTKTRPQWWVLGFFWDLRELSKECGGEV